ncbi:GGDEF domain-containing protein [Clostridium sp.]|uniref:GGDEF domain-containing protein n=1 Tax=Clostridium sp. TaxID=1506 RepID=UPI002610A125|nr:GGDEF domain-containing protein [Clostridium sp.]
MYQNSLDIIEFTKWNRKILKAYWIIAVISNITENIIFFTVSVKNGNGNFFHYQSYVLRPTLFNIILFSIVELLYRFTKERYKEASKYLIIIAGTMLVCNLVYVHYAVSVIYVLFIFPIMLSVYYGNKKITLFSLILNLLSYLLIVFFYLPTKPIDSTNHNITDICTTTAFIISSVLLVYSFIDRSNEIINSFIDIYKNEQDLLVKNFIMEFNSKIEPVTGLYNHKTFYEYLGQLIDQSESFNFPLSLAVIDIDNFKRINDTYGHSLGDKVILVLSEIIKSSIGTDDYASRYGGEEFAIIFTDKDQNKVFEKMEAIRIAFNNTVINEMNSERFSISIGISEISKGISKETLFTNADKALYTAKKTVKNKTIIYE